jgi:hypothetical protein
MTSTFFLNSSKPPKVVLPFTSYIDPVLEAIGRMEAGGSTPLFDAVHLGVNEMRHASYPRKARLWGEGRKSRLISSMRVTRQSGFVSGYFVIQAPLASRPDKLGYIARRADVPR